MKGNLPSDSAAHLVQMLKLELLWEALLVLFLVLLLRIDSVPSVQLAVASAPTDQSSSLHVLKRQPIELANPDPPLSQQQQRQFVARNRIRLPLNGSVNTLPLQFACEFAVDNSDEFYRRYKTQLLCIEIDGQWRHCSPTRNEPPLFANLSPGAHSAVAFLVANEDSDEWLLESESIVFTVLHRQQYQEYVDKRKREERERFGIEDDVSLLMWTTSQPRRSTVVSEQQVNAQGDFVEPSLTAVNGISQEDQRLPPPLLVIGVKTSVLRGFKSRQAIRATWGNSASLDSQGVKLVFAGCQPVISNSHQDKESLFQAIATEKQRYGDLLTDELECEDSYFTLPTKVKEFLHFAATKFPQAPYIMIADDDIYLRVDQLTQALRQHGPRKKFYAGQVWAKQFLSPVVPVRNPNHKNYLPEAQYPMNTLLPFVFGPHYFMSMDCAEFIGSNRHALVDFTSLDDVSIAIWLFALQVHPEHVPSFQNLRDVTCREGLVSFADLSAHAIRVIHTNLQADAPYCRGFDIATWLKTDQAAVVDQQDKPKRTAQVASRINSYSKVLQVVTTLTVDAEGITNSTSKGFSFSPSHDIFAEHCAAIAAYLDEQQISTQSDISTQVHKLMTRTLSQAVEDRIVSSAFIELWLHNLQFYNQATPPRTIIIVYSRKGAFSKVLLECLFTAVYSQNPVQVLDEDSFQVQQQSADLPAKRAPDVFVFSILDGGRSCTSHWAPPCQQAAADVVERYGNSSTVLVMIAGEPWDVQRLDERVLLISTVSQVPKDKYVYLPMASMFFGERVIQSPMLLLASHRARKSSIQSIDTSLLPRKFCAYMYARCDRPQREYMFDLLNALEPIDALGVCQGAAQKQIQQRWRSRWSVSVFQDAINMYAQYKFVIAFENAQQPGYVTEKIMNAFLAGSIPIYLGHSDSVSRLFNSRSFIDCGKFATLRKCAERVMEIHQSTELYESMLSEPVIGNVTLFYELFSWHPDVPSSHLASQVARLI